MFISLQRFELLGDGAAFTSAIVRLVDNDEESRQLDMQACIYSEENMARDLVLG
jgi:hypothetical protein